MSAHKDPLTTVPVPPVGESKNLCPSQGRAVFQPAWVGLPGAHGPPRPGLGGPSRQPREAGASQGCDWGSETVRELPGPHGLDLEERERHPGHDTAVTSLARAPHLRAATPGPFASLAKGFPRRTQASPSQTTWTPQRGPSSLNRHLGKPHPLRKRHPDPILVAVPEIRAPAAENRASGLPAGALGSPWEGQV